MSTRLSIAHTLVHRVHSAHRRVPYKLFRRRKRGRARVWCAACARADWPGLLLEQSPRSRPGRPPPSRIGAAVDLRLSHSRGSTFCVCDAADGDLLGETPTDRLCFASPPGVVVSVLLWLGGLVERRNDRYEVPFTCVSRPRVTYRSAWELDDDSSERTSGPSGRYGADTRSSSQPSDTSRT